MRCTLNKCAHGLKEAIFVRNRSFAKVKYIPKSSRRRENPTSRKRGKSNWANYKATRDQV